LSGQFKLQSCFHNFDPVDLPDDLISDFGSIFQEVAGISTARNIYPEKVHGHRDDLSSKQVGTGLNPFVYSDNTVLRSQSI
jgi:hypothetical protein